MDNHFEGVEDGMISNLSFKHGVGASYVTDKRSCTFFPNGSEIYSSDNVKLIKIAVSGYGWVDLESIKIFFQLNNTDPTAGKKLYPLVANPQAFSDVLRYFQMVLSYMIWIILIELQKWIVN